MGVFWLEELKVYGGNPLIGELSVQGAKNSSLPLLAAAVLVKGKTVLHNCPRLRDVEIAFQIMRHLGCIVKREDDTVEIDSTTISCSEIPEVLMGEMRSSIVFLGAIVARTGMATVNFPGGCELGPRPIDLHLACLRQLGILIDEHNGILDCSIDKLKGSKITLSFPSVGATENVILAACTAEGETIITNAAAEPEIVDLACFLNRCGAKIYGAGEKTIVIQGVSRLQASEYRVIPDRIALVTWLCAGAITGGELLLKQIVPEHIEGVLPFLEQTGVKLLVDHHNIYLRSTGKLNAMSAIRTMPYPGFPTDAQPMMMALASKAAGTTVFVENIFENRYKHAVELTKMGADITLEGKVAVVEGVPTLSGARVRATDLRSGAALVVAGLAAEGITYISDPYHIDRGYEPIEETLCQLGAVMSRIK